MPKQYSSGTQAGYDWAKRNDIDQEDVDNYQGNSESFRNGMQLYVDEKTGKGL